MFIRRIIFISVIFGVTSVEAYDCDEFRGDPRRLANCNCQAPNSPYLFSKLEEALALEAGIKELKEVVTEPKNYELRNEIKSAYRSLQYARRREKQKIVEKMSSDFEKMIDAAQVRDEIQDFPVKGASSKITSLDDSIMISMKNITPLEELSFLPKAISGKVGSSVSIRYFYPIDRYEYLLSYEGNELPLKTVFLKMQSEFEASCLAMSSDNADIRDGKAKERRKKGGGSSAQ